VVSSLQLLGVPKVTTAGNLSDLPLDKPASLLFYLARRGDWVSRSELAFLYRPDAPEKVALGNVRVYLHRARERLWAQSLEVEKFRVRYLVETDVQAFEDALERQAWAAALELYRGPFLSGIQVQDAPGFETWLELERQDLA
jgi:DNA-binding SARP family transcriptional activator